jgi:hypothetical protein
LRPRELGRFFHPALLLGHHRFFAFRDQWTSRVHTLQVVQIPALFFRVTGGLGGSRQTP